MAKTQGVWGIDIGQCALKALRCRVEGDSIVADAFDFIEYPKILSQPEADPESLVREALEQFLSRNEIKGDRIAMSVPGQSGLAKFFKPPPVDAKRIPEIVKYEARQQIPFDLDDVIWDYQRMGGGSEVDGFALETEVGLFAMKREQVYRAIKPFDQAEVELDIVQLAPLCIYNFITYDVLADRTAEDFDPENPPESLVVLSMGTESTDLVVTNGFRVWQRSIPLGGNHFTKQLMKELKLTFARAEHLKRNARQAEDPKMVFKAMRPVFNDMVTEVQRSIGYFQSIDRKAKIGGVVLLGNTVKLPGLQQYLAKNLGYEVVDFESFARLQGSSVTSSPAFQDNLLAFGVTYGLCLQGLDQSTLSTNLVPREILNERMLRAKKPWALASVGALLLGCTFSFCFYYGVWNKVDQSKWQGPASGMENVQSQSRNFETLHSNKVAQLNLLDRIGEELVGNADRKRLWLEVIKAVNAALPVDQEAPPGTAVDVKEKPFQERQLLHITRMESEYFPDLATWFSDNVKARYTAALPVTAAAEGAADQTAVDPAAGTETAVPGPTGAGFVIELEGYHMYNQHGTPATHVRNSFLQKLNSGDFKVRLPDGRGGFDEFTMNDLGIGFALLVDDGVYDQSHRVRNPNYVGPTREMGGEGGMMDEMAQFSAFPQAGTGFRPGSTGGRPTNGNKDVAGETEEPPEPEFLVVPKYSFRVQFCWQEKPLTQRLEEIEKRRKEEAERQQAEQQQDNSVASTNDGGSSL